MKRLAAVFISLLMLFILCSSVLAANVDNIVSDIKTKAENDKYRFMLVDGKGITPEIKQSLVDNDRIYLSEKPIGSVKVVVMDADTGEPVKDVQCLLSFQSMRYEVNTDGSKKQIANPFLLFDLGKTPANGEIVFNDAYFYTTSKIEQGAEPFADSLSVHLANIVDEDPEIAINVSAPNYIATSDKASFDAIVNKIDGRTNLKFSELKEIIKNVASNKYAEIVRYLFDDEFAVFSDSVKVKISEAPQFKKLTDAGKQELTIGELKVYIKENHDLFKQYVAARHYADFGGFEPNFTIQYEPEYESVTTYKNGTKKTTTSTAYLGMRIFDDVKGGTGYVVSSSGFSYKAYVFADGYMEGVAIGAGIRQDFVDRDIISRIYISKNNVPVVVPDKSNAITGILKDSKDKPVGGATIQILNTEFKAVTNAEGNFSFTKLKDEAVKLAITNPENGEPMTAKAIYKGKEYPLDNIPVKFTGENQVFQITLISGAAAAMATGAAGGISIWLILLIVVLLIFLLFIFFIFMRKKKKYLCRHCGAELNKKTKFCNKCGNQVIQ